ncbi:uncharacterized protein KGF55_003906 [Candida pseudojiufengensis]|uniref:uncharacterized protein n=1 Tax=Candida pseudojiufengensis TaxID=497109 RepID=UPI0022247895|nr:uncharacterized protein KGF55_003906 [Candida pseudojiufengensis]KAI5961589.1 hypothetical protein KGF55_003906 [Candida pseudojiufengensis]
MEGSSQSQEVKANTPTPEVELNPQRIKALMKKLKEELEASKTESDPIKQREHLAVVEKIKRVLVAFQEKKQNEQQQQQQQQQQQPSRSNSVSQSENNPTPSNGNQPNSASSIVNNQINQLPNSNLNSQSQTPVPPSSSSLSQAPSIIPQQQVQSSNTQTQPSYIQPSTQNPSQATQQTPLQPQSQTQPNQTQPIQTPQIQSPIPQKPNSNPNDQKVTIEKYQRVKTVLKELVDKVQSLTSAREKETDPIRKQTIDKQIAESRSSLQQYHRGAMYMRSVLVESGRLSANSTPVNVTTPKPVAANVSQPSVSNQPPASSNQTNANNSTSNPAIKPQTNTVSTPAKTDTPSVSTPNFTNSSNINKKSASPVPAVIPTTKPRVPNSTSTIFTPTATTTSNVKTPTVSRVASSVKLSTPTQSQPPVLNIANPTIKRPLLNNPINSNSTTNLVNSLNYFQDSTKTPTNIPDNDNRVLTKRKLNELITNISIDQGDSKTAVDNDVEEIFLDLADEFVKNVMEFSCNLAKHRKLDKIDIKDVQLNLENNWGIKVPGYMSDEIKAARRWNQKSDKK